MKDRKRVHIKWSDPPLRRTRRAAGAYRVLDACIKRLGKWAEVPRELRFDAFGAGLNVAGFGLEIRRTRGSDKQWVRIVRAAKGSS